MRNHHIARKVAVLIMTAAILAGCGGAEGRKTKYLERGKDYLAQENYSKALIEFKNVLQIDPKYAEAYFYLGRAEEGRRNFQQAFGLYSKAVELNSDYLEARARLGQFYLLGGDPAKAKEQMDAILAKDPAHVGGRLLKAQVMSKEGKDEEALKVASELIKVAPSEFEAYSFAAAIYLKQGNTDKSVDVLRQGIAANPKSIPLRLSLIQVYGSKRDNSKVEELLQECVSIEPEKLRHRVDLASFLAKTNQTDKAEKVLRAAIEQDPEDDQRHLLLADFLFNQKSKEAAEQELLKAVKEYPKSGNLRFGLANLYERTGDAPKATDVYREIVSYYGEKPEGLRARNQLAKFLLRQGKQDEAEKLTEEVLKENSSDNDALLMKGRISIMKRDALNAITALRTVLRDQPNLVDAYLYLADAHTLNKEPALAKESLMKAAELNPKDTRAHLALAKYHARIGDISAAAKKVDEALKLSPNDFEALEAKLEMLLAKKDTKSAQTILEKIKAAHPDNPLGYYQMGQIYLAQRKYDAAIREFEQALPKSRDDYQLMSAIVTAYLAQKKPEKAISRLNDALAKDSSAQLFVHELLAEIYITQKKYSDAELALHKAIEANPKWNVPYRNLANLQLVRGDFSAAGQIYQQGLKEIPDDPQLLLHLAGTYERTRDYEKAIAIYERVLGKDSANDLATNNLAALLLDHRTDADSLKRAKELAVRFESSSQPAFMDTLGWMYYRSGELDRAIALLEKIVKQAPTISIFHYHLGMAYYQKGDLSSAKSHLVKAVEGKGDYTGLEEARATLKKIP